MEFTAASIIFSTHVLLLQLLPPFAQVIGMIPVLPNSLFNVYMVIHGAGGPIIDALQLQSKAIGLALKIF